MNYLQFATTILIAVITFTMQKTLSNFIAGMLLRISHRFKKDDRVVVTQNHNVLVSGWVVKIYATSTVIKTYEKNLVSIPNAKLFDDCVVINSSAKPKYNYPQSIELTLNSDIDAAKLIILSNILNNELTHNTTENTDLTTSIQNGKIIITYNVRTYDDMDNSFKACDEILVSIIRDIRETNNIWLA